MWHKLLHYHGKLKTVGLERFSKGVLLRLRQNYFARSQANVQLPSHIISQRKDLSYLNWHEKQNIASLADQYAHNQFGFLGSRMQQYASLPWYQDVRLMQDNAKADVLFDNASFYAQINVPTFPHRGIAKDIKVPWELARFQWAPLLAVAYCLTNKKIYLDQLQNHIDSWISSAPYLHGIHWMNPMECAIRASNWVIAYYFLQKTLFAKGDFFNRFCKSLYEHLIYIEHNWEWYDGRTNNHYLSNIIGYGYLAWFFNDTRRFKNMVAALNKEFAWQLFSEGSSYEGSTAYHQLVTELFMHGFALAQCMGYELSIEEKAKLERMVFFAQLTGNLMIGDEDGGHFVSPSFLPNSSVADWFDLKITEKISTHCFPEFGIMVMQSADWQLSLRGYAYQSRQPSAHFHEDMGSVTIANKGIPLFIDPGSYLYSASMQWRNYFRSIQQHSSFYPEGWAPVAHRDLFSMPFSEARFDGFHDQQTAEISHSYFGFPVSRKVMHESDTIIITDSWQTEQRMVWQWIVHPAINLVHQGDTDWLLLYKQKPVARLQSDIPLRQKRGWCSLQYGEKKECWVLTGINDDTMKRATIYLTQL